MKREDLEKKNIAELKDFINEKREELRSVRFNASGSGMRDTQSVKHMRREVARALTELGKRAREEAHNDA